MLLGVPRSRVAATVHEGQVWAWITIDGSLWAVQPVTDADADASLHVVYRAEDVVPGDWKCGVEANLIDQVGEHLGTLPAGGGTKLCEIAWDKKHARDAAYDGYKHITMLTLSCWVVS
jgi:hypothetical protein